MFLYVLPMSRTRAQRRHNTFVKTSARKAIKAEGSPYCGLKISRNGEACSCSLCITCDSIEDGYTEAFRATQLSEFIKSFDD